MFYLKFPQIHSPKENKRDLFIKIRDDSFTCDFSLCQTFMKNISHHLNSDTTDYTLDNVCIDYDFQIIEELFQYHEITLNEINYLSAEYFSQLLGITELADLVKQYSDYLSEINTNPYLEKLITFEKFLFGLNQENIDETVHKINQELSVDEIHIIINIIKSICHYDKTKVPILTTFISSMPEMFQKMFTESFLAGISYHDKEKLHIIQNMYNNNLITADRITKCRFNRKYFEHIYSESTSKTSNKSKERQKNTLKLISYNNNLESKNNLENDSDDDSDQDFENNSDGEKDDDFNNNFFDLDDSDLNDGLSPLFTSLLQFDSHLPSKSDLTEHIKSVNEGFNTSELAVALRNDDIDKLQQLSIEKNFQFNDTIPKCFYEANKKLIDVKLIDYAAFYRSLKCFKFLLINGAKIKSNYFAIAGGSPEIIRICEQNKVAFYNSLNVSIKYHQNIIFDWLLSTKCTITKPNAYCSYAYHGRKYIKQEWYSCNQCQFIGHLGICSLCAQKCHSEHNPIFRREARCFCDCGDSENCKCMPTHLSKHYCVESHDVIIHCYKSNNFSCLKRLAANGVNIFLPKFLQIAAENDDIMFIKFLLSYPGIDINEFFENKKTNYQSNSSKSNILHYCCKNNKKNIFDLIITHPKLDINLPNDVNLTPLHLALMNHSYDIASTLLDMPNINISNNISNDLSNNISNLKSGNKDTLLNACCRAGHFDLFKKLLDKGAEIKNDKPSKRLLLDACSSNSLEIVKYLMCRDDIRYKLKDADDNSILHRAVRNENIEIVKYLINTRKFDINAINFKGQTILRLACSTGNLKLIQLILDTDGIDLSYFCNTFPTALHYACENDLPDLVRLLLDGEYYDVNLTNDQGETPLHIAALNDYATIVVNLLFCDTIDPNARDEHGNTPLHFACMNSCMKVIPILIKDPYVDNNAVNNCGFTPIASALRSMNIELVLQMIDYEDIDLNSCADGNSLLSLASSLDVDERIIKKLVQKNLENENKS